MVVTLQFANQVRRLARQNLTVRQIAHRLGLPEQAIMDALFMPGMPLPDEVVEQRPTPTEEERAAIHAKLPKKWQDRTNKTE